MTRNDCIKRLADKFGLTMAETARLYDDVMEIVMDAYRQEGRVLDGWDMEAEFIRLSDPATKKRIAQAAADAIDGKAKKRTAKILMTNQAAVNSEARVIETLMDAERLGRLIDKKGWYSNWGKIDPVKAVMSFLIGDGSGLPGSRRSLSALREGFDREDFGTLIDFFLKNPEIKKLHDGIFSMFPKKRELYRAKMREFTVNVVDDILKGRVGSSDAMHTPFAKLMVSMMNRSTDRFTKAGAFITQMKNYVPSNPDAARIAAVTEDEFVDTMMHSNIVDWNTSFYDHPQSHVLRGSGTPEQVQAARRDVMADMYRTMTNKAKRMEDGTLVKSDSVAARFEHHMQMRFADGEGWVKFHELFGRHQDIVSAASEKLQFQNRLAALMTGFGPNPEQGFNIMRKRLIDKIKSGEIRLSDETKADVLSKLEKADVTSGNRLVDNLEFKDLDAANKSIRSIVSPDDGGLSMAFSEIAGDTLFSVNHTAAEWAGRARVAVNMADLGRTVITAITDVPNILFNNVARGRTWGEAVSAYVHAYKMNASVMKAEFAEIAPYIRMYNDGILGQFHSRCTMNEPGIWPRIQNGYFKANFLTQWTDIQKRISAATNMSWLGDNSHLSWSQLGQGKAGQKLKWVLKMHGITPAKWEAIRTATWTAPDGSVHVVPGALDRIPLEQIRHILRNEPYPTDAPWQVRRAYEERMRTWQADPEKFRDQLRADLVGMLNDEVRYGVIESDDRVRYFAYRGTSPGTMPGEILRFMMQYKAYAIGLADRVWARSAFSPGGKHIPGLPDAATFDMDVAKWIAMATAGGYISQALSDVSKGYYPRDVTGEHGWQTFMTAFEKGGAGAVYGDVLFDIMSGYDQSWMEKGIGMVLGPVGGKAMELADVLTAEGNPMPHIWNGLKSGDPRFSKLFKFMLNNAPYNNIFYSRMALDYGILYNMEEFLKPGTISNRHRWNERELGREAIYTPGG